MFAVSFCLHFDYYSGMWEILGSKQVWLQHQATNRWPQFTSGTPAKVVTVSMPCEQIGIQSPQKALTPISEEISTFMFSVGYSGPLDGNHIPSLCSI